MKHKRWINAALALALALLLIPAAPAVAQDLADATPWELTRQGMLALEGVADGDDLFVVESGAYAQYGFLRFGGAHNQVAVYIFNADRLVMYGYNAGASMQAGTVDFAGVYQTALAQLTERLGEPTTADTLLLVAESNAIMEGSMNEEDILAGVGWDMGDGVMLYHMHLKNAREESVVTMLVNEALLLAQ